MTEPTRFLFVGQVRREKGVDDIVVTARLLLRRKVRFSISIAGPTVGWEQDTFAPKIVDEVQSDPALSTAISFLGAIEDVDAAFRAHDVHLAPSKVEESYGLVVVEAKQNARPSIVYPSGGMVELVQHKRDGWICERKSSDCLADAMLHFINAPSEISTMGENAKSSLETLGLSRERFNSQWASIVAGVSRN